MGFVGFVAGVLSVTVANVSTDFVYANAPPNLTGGPCYPREFGTMPAIYRGVRVPTNLTGGPCYPREFGTMPAIYRGVRVQHCERAVEWFGNEQRLQEFASKVLMRQCVHLVFLGGSITCGNRADGRQYPITFTWLLNRRFPCQGGEHTMDNLCRGASGSSQAWEVVNSMAARPSINRSSLVFVEKGVNDVDSYWNEQIPGVEHGSADVEYWTEAVARAMGRLFPHVPVAWFDLFIADPKNVDPPYERDSDREHRKVVEYYDLPMLSMKRVLGPLSWKPRADWLHDHFFQVPVDYLHPGPAAHELMAGVLMLYVEGLLARANSSDGLQSFLLPPGSRLGVLPPPLVLSPAEAAFLDAEAVLSLDLSSASNATKARLVWPGSWSFATDMPKKPRAFMSTQAGGACAMLDLGAIGAVSTVVVNVLYSYANFGTLLMQLLEPADCTETKVPDPSNISAWALPPQINRTIDCKWDSGTSQVSRITSRVDMKARAARRKDCSLVLKLCNVSPQERSKLKVFSIDFFS